MSGKASNPNHGAFFAAFGKRVKELRNARGWSLRDMILRHGYHASQWQVFEKGSNVTLDSLLRMASVFEMTLTELMGDLGEFPRKYTGAHPGDLLRAAPLATQGQADVVKANPPVKAARKRVGAAKRT